MPGAGNSGSGADPEPVYNYEADLRASDAEEARRRQAAAAAASRPAPHPAPATPTPTAVALPGPVENSGTLLATALTIGVVGGLFLWVTSGPQMARANPQIADNDDRDLIELQQDVMRELHRFGLWNPSIRARVTSQGLLQVKGITPSGEWIGQAWRGSRLAHIARSHGYVILGGHKESIVFGFDKPELNTARGNPRGLRFDERKGVWLGAKSRTLYHVTDTRTGHTVVRDILKGVGPAVTIRLATRAEADAAGWPAGWIVADNARSNPS